MESILIQICRIRWWFWFFSFLDCKDPFGDNLVQKVKSVKLNWNLISRLFRLLRIYLDYSECFFGDVHLFCFRPSSAKFVEKIH